MRPFLENDEEKSGKDELQNDTNLFLSSDTYYDGDKEHEAKVLPRVQVCAQSEFFQTPQVFLALQ